MGRHSIPDPGESADDATAADAPAGDDEPDYRAAPTPPERRPPDYRRPEFLQRRDEPSRPEPGQRPGYPPADPPPPGFRRPGYQEPPAYEDRPTPPYDDRREPAYGTPGYGDRPFGQPGYTEPENADSDHSDSDDADYGDADYGDAGYGDAGYGDAGYDDVDYSDSGYDGPDYDEPASGRDDRRATPPLPPPPSTPTGPAHGGDWDGGEWTGSHRAITDKRRGVSVGVIAALITVVVVVGVFILWRFFGDALSNRSAAGAARCVDGDLTVSVLADPSIADQIGTLATKYNDEASPVGDRCVKVGVKAAESDAVVDGFTSKWPSDLGERPALWVPASSVSEARLEAVTGKESVSDTRSLVTSPVLIAVRPQLKAALAQQNWGTLPGLQSNPNGLAGVNLPTWGSLRLSLPLSGDADASYLAAEAVAAAAAPDGGPASSGVGAVNTLMAGQPKLADNTSSTALDALLKAADPATAPVHAVVATEQQIFEQGAALPNAKNTLAAWVPPGPAAVADYPTVLLSGEWLGKEQVAAASEFARFMRKPENLSELAKAGFRTDGGSRPASDVTSFAPIATPLSVGDNGMRVTLANALGAPSGNPAVTIMLDQSMSADEGGKSRLANVVAALNARLQALPPSAAVGLWTFDGAEGRSEVPTGPLSDQVNGRPRSAALTSALDGQAPAGSGAVSFTTLRLIYDDAVANFRQGQTNSVLVITTGPHTDQSLDGQGLQEYVRGAFDPAKPVSINVVDFGSDADRSAWEAIAQISGGEYQNLATSASPELSSAITTFLN